MRIVIAEDSAVVRAGLAEILTDSGHQVLAAVGNAGDLLAAVDEHRPDAAVVDVRMPPGYTDEGLRAAITIRRDHPETGVLVFSQYIETRYAADLLGAAPGGSAAGRYPAQRLDEFLDVADPVLEQVPDPCGTATGHRAEQVGRVPGLDVLGEHEHPGLGVVAADRDRGAQALVGVAGRHPHVHHGGVRTVLVHRGQQVAGVAYGGEDLVAAVSQDFSQAGSYYSRIFGDHDPHRSSGSVTRGTAAQR